MRLLLRRLVLMLLHRVGRADGVLVKHGRRVLQRWGRDRRVEQREQTRVDRRSRLLMGRRRRLVRR